MGKGRFPFFFHTLLNPTLRASPRTFLVPANSSEQIKNTSNQIKLERTLQGFLIPPLPQLPEGGCQLPLGGGSPLASPPCPRATAAICKENKYTNK